MTVDKFIKDHCKAAQGEECDIGDVYVLEKKSKKRQMQKLIWDCTTYIQERFFPKHTKDGVLTMMIVENNSQNSIVKVTRKDLEEILKRIEGREYCFIPLTVRKSTALKNNTKDSYQRMIESIESFMLDLDEDVYSEYFNKVE